MSRPFNRGLWLASAAGLALGAGAAHAQPASETSAQPPEVTEVIVTAQRRAERLQDVPLSITAQTADQLERQGVENLRDLSVAVPGLRMATTGPNLQPAIRGVSSQQSDPGNDANVAVYLDGVYQANELANNMDLPDVERIEVAKGPQGTLFGRNATGGAIQIFTKQPSFTPTGRVQLGYARFDDVTAKGFVSGPLAGDVLAGSLAGFYERSDGFYRNLATGGKFKGIDAKTIRGKLLAVPTDNARFTLTVAYTDRYDDQGSQFVALNGNSMGRGTLSADGSTLIPTPGAIVSRPYYEAAENEPAFIHVKDFAASLRSELDVGAGTFTSITAYDRNRVNNDIETDQSTADVLFYNLIDRATNFSQELTFASEKMGPVSFVAGLFYYYNKGGYDSIRVHGASLGTLEIDVFAQQKTHAYAAFGEVNVELTDRLTAIGGLRYSREKREAAGANGFTATNMPVGAPDPLPKLGSHTWDSFTPRISLRYTLDDAGDNAYATYSTGFKSGGYSLATLETTPFKPEKIKAFEVGLKTSPQRRLSANIAAFYYDYTDQQVQAIVNNFNVTANAAASHIKGIDVDALARVTPEFTLQAGVSLLDAKFTDYPNATTNVPITFTSGPNRGLPCFCGNLTGQADVSGNRPIRSPTWTVNLTAAYSHETAAGQFDASATLYHSAKFYFDVENRVRQPSFTTLGARASFSPANTGVKLSVWGQNLTNEHIIEGVFLLNQADGVNYGPPRTFGATVEYAF
jgi:iron complex outermembrane receptor protein